MLGNAVVPGLAEIFGRFILLAEGIGNGAQGQGGDASGGPVA